MRLRECPVSFSDKNTSRRLFASSVSTVKFAGVSVFSKSDLFRDLVRRMSLAKPDDHKDHRAGRDDQADDLRCRKSGHCRQAEKIAARIVPDKFDQKSED